MESIEESWFFLLAKETEIVIVVLSGKSTAFGMGTRI
jgi:hypothetical protein